MKYLAFNAFLLVSAALHAQTPDEKAILNLSEKMFRWEVENKIDSLDKLWDQQFVVVGGDGQVQTKSQYLATLRSGNFVHNSIVVETNKASVANGTGTIVGKGKFTVTVSGKKKALQLSYIEVYTKNQAGDWKVLALHATVLPDSTH